MSTPVRAAQAPVPPCLGREYAPGTAESTVDANHRYRLCVREPPISVIPGDELVIRAAHLH